MYDLCICIFKIVYNIIFLFVFQTWRSFKFKFEYKCIEKKYQEYNNINSVFYNSLNLQI